MAHTNGMESFWATLKRAHKGVYHKISEKHLGRYVRQFAGKHNVRDADTIRQMQNVVAGMVGKRLMYRDLIAADHHSEAAIVLISANDPTLDRAALLAQGLGLRVLAQLCKPFTLDDLGAPLREFDAAVTAA